MVIAASVMETITVAAKATQLIDFLISSSLFKEIEFRLQQRNDRRPLGVVRPPRKKARNESELSNSVFLQDLNIMLWARFAKRLHQRDSEKI
jgi:hypothetical protein